MSVPLAQLQRRIGYSFRNPALLVCAVTHKSYVVDHPEEENNQRLEFLGDAVLQILLAEALFHCFPSDREGVLTKRRALLVNRNFLAALAREIGADTSLRLSPSEEKVGGRDRVTALGDAFEAIVGAIYLDSDLATTRTTVMAIYGDLRTRLVATEDGDNPKGRLQEIIQPVHGNAIRYELLRTHGVDHAREYEVNVFLFERQLGTGRGTSKKIAEEAAARQAIEVLKSEK